MKYWSNDWHEEFLLHNRPFYSIVVLKDKIIPPKIIVCKKSYYELSCSIEWTPSDCRKMSDVSSLISLRSN